MSTTFKTSERFVDEMLDERCTFDNSEQFYDKPTIRTWRIDPGVDPAINQKSMEYLARLEEVRSLIGNTPLLQIDFSYRGKRRNLFA